MAGAEDTISQSKLISSDDGLRQRLRRLHVVQNPTKTNINGLLAALSAFGWLKDEGNGRYSLSADGVPIARDSVHNPTAFRRKLAVKLHERYVVPGWFVARLYDLNPAGQGQVVLPAPRKSGKTERRPWAEKQWPTEFGQIVVESAEAANRVFPGSFDVDLSLWLKVVRASWEELGEKQPPGGRKGTLPNRTNTATFSPRERLFHAMREASVHLLFSGWSPSTSQCEFPTIQHPMPPRAFQVWCPRLDELDFIFYTDYHPDVAGRIIVPCGAFRKQAPTPPFEELPAIRDPSARSLWLFQPGWDNVAQEFLDVLQHSYRRVSRRAGAIYVSLLNVRDEVCRQLRLSSRRFDILLEAAYRQSIGEKTSYKTMLSISLESDFRPEQLGAVGRNRRPVYINSVPHSLISLASIRTP